MTVGADGDAELFQLDRATCLSLLTTQHVGRLVIGGDDPAVLPVNYVVREGTITFRTESGSRADRAAAHTVLFEVDMFDDRTRSGWSVLVRGPLAATEDADTAAVETWAPGVRDRSLTVLLHEVTGRLLRGAVDEPNRDGGGYL